jgi:hypothetical protein
VCLVVAVPHQVGGRREGWGPRPSRSAGVSAWRPKPPRSGTGWYAYAFPTPNFPDYPKYGAWHDAYYVTTNEGGGSPVYALEVHRC